MKYISVPGRHLTYAMVNRAIEEAFAEHGRGHVQMPPKVYITFDAGDFRTMPAYMPGLEIAGVKIVNVHPRNHERGLPTIMALTIILNIDTGLPEAIINATELTTMRTGAAGAVAAKYLSPKREVTLGIIGSGQQAEAQLMAVSEELNVNEVRVWTRTAQHAEEFAARYDRYNARSVPIERACDCDILITTTPSRKPLIRDAWVHEGTHINAIGADAPKKQELDPALLLRADVYVDDRKQAVHSGEINVPVSTGLYSPDMIAGTLGEVVILEKKRSRKEAITIFDSTGLAVQDLAIAKIAIKEAEGIELPFP